MEQFRLMKLKTRWAESTIFCVLILCCNAFNGGWSGGSKVATTVKPFVP